MQTCYFSRILHFSIHQLLNHSEKIFAIYTIIYSSKISISLVPFPIPWIVHLHQHVPISVYVKGVYASIESRTELWICFHCVKSVLIRSFSGPYFPTFRLNTERYRVTHRIQFEYVEIWTISWQIFGHWKSCCNKSIRNTAILNSATASSK